MEVSPEEKKLAFDMAEDSSADKITIGRPRGGRHTEDEISIVIQDANYKVLYRGLMKPEDFARALTGQGFTPIVRDLPNYIVREREP